MKTQAQLSPRLALTLLISLNFLGFLPSAHGQNLVQGWQNRIPLREGFSLNPEFSSYTTSTNFDQNSKPLTISNPASVSKKYFDLNISYQPESEWYGFARLSFASVNGINGASDQLLGAGRTVFHSDATEINIQSAITLPLYQNTARSPQLGDQSVDLTFGGFIQRRFFRSHQLEGGVGFTYRSRSFSSAIPLSLMYRLDPSVIGFQYEGGLRSQFSLENDPSSPVANKSSLFSGENPSWTLIQAKGGYRSSAAFSTYALIAAPLFGKNAASGIQVSVGLDWSFDPPTSTNLLHPTRDSNEDDFNSYDLDAKVTAANDQLYLVKINEGKNSDVEKGQVFDIFEVRRDTESSKEGEVLVARARVSYVKSNETALNVVEYYRDQWIEQGFIARRKAMK